MAKPELGIKRLCAGCGAKFYDLSKNPIVCPKCSTVFEIATSARARPEAVAAPVKAAAPEEAVAPETQEAEFVSLEEADAEAKGAKKPTGEAAEDDDVELDETMDDDATFIEEQEEEDADVTDIIGGDIENEEET